MAPPGSEPPPPEPPIDQTGVEPAVLRVMSLNLYGWATMPGAAPDYAALIEAQSVDVLGIQEGNWDWEIEGWPTDYSATAARWFSSWTEASTASWLVTLPVRGGR